MKPFRTRSSLAIIALGLLFASFTAIAGLPAELAFESFGGRFFVSETAEGRAFAIHEIGRPVHTESEYVELLNKVRAGTASRSETEAAQDQINKLNEQIGTEPRSESGELFGAAKNAARAQGLTLLRSEATAMSIQFVAMASELSPQSMRQAFLEGTPLNRAQLEAASGRSTALMDLRAGKWIREKQCLSCHSIHPFTAARAGTPDWQSSPLGQIKTYIETRITTWDDARVWYHNQRAASQASELIIGLSMLTQVSETSRAIEASLEHLVALQAPDGGFPWLSFELQPWESTEGRIYGNSQALETFSRLSPELQTKYADAIFKLRSYLTGQARLPTTSLWNRLALLSADTRAPGLITAGERKEIIDTLLQLQHSDGGWSMNDLSTWKKRGSAPGAQAGASDGYASAYSLYILRREGLLGAEEWLTTSPRWKKGIQWLVANQTETGTWSSYSVNRNSPFNHGLVEDATTAYGNLALRSWLR